MTVRLLLLAAGAVLSVGFALWTYRRELRVRGRWALATARAASLLLVLMLLFDLRVPLPRSSPEQWVLVDGSVSMRVGTAGAAPWDSARALARSLVDKSARMIRFGVEPVSDTADRMAASPPAAPRSLLVPALEHAAEGGARSVVVLSDFLLEDPVAVRATLERLEMGARFVTLGGDVRNAGVAVFELPTYLEAGATLTGELTLFASGAGPTDSATVEVREEGRLVWSAPTPLPASGRQMRIPLGLPPPGPDSEGRGEVRYEATVTLEGDAFADDDRAVAFVVVDPREGALVAVSLEPDWELRHLLSLLERVTGLPTRGFLRAGDRFLPTGGDGGPGTVSEGEVTALVDDAHLVVLYGLGVTAPQWALEAVAEGSRVLMFARDQAGAAAAGIATASPQSGEWDVDPEPRASPLAGDLSGVRFQGLPPLVELLPRLGLERGAVPLMARLRGSEPPAPALILREREEARVVVVLASGWWRWALRPGVAEEAYGRVWSAVAGWLLATGPVGSGRVRPQERVVGPGAPVRWSGGGVVPLRLTLFAGDSVVADTTLAEPVEEFATPALSPGSYRYRAVAEADTTSGRFDVHAPSPELRHPRMQLPDSLPAGPGQSGRARARPLRAHPAPYLLLLVLLCWEWIGRRRKGLR